MDEQYPAGSCVAISRSREGRDVDEACGHSLSFAFTRRRGAFLRNCRPNSSCPGPPIITGIFQLQTVQDAGCTSDAAQVQ